MNLKAKLLSDMKVERPNTGLITQYLAYMRGENPEGAATLEADMHSTFTTPEGLRVLKMFEKAVLYRSEPLGESNCALRESNAARNLILEIRRIVSHGQ